MAIRAVLFDLDGTLVQTREASWQLFAETNEQFRLGVDSREQFFALFQDNFFRSLASRCGDPQRLADVKEHFLNLLRTRYTPPLVPGMADVVRLLAARFTLVVISTNTMETIRKILRDAGLAHCFAHVFAGDVEPDKSVSIQRFLSDAGYRLGRRCSPAYDEGGPALFEAGDEALLVTDTVGDIKEATTAGVRAIGVAWGMHTEPELVAAGAERVALWPQELCAWILPEAEVGCISTMCACSREPAYSAASAARQQVLVASQTRRDRRPHPEATHARVIAARDVATSQRATAVIDTQLLATLGRLRLATDGVHRRSRKEPST